MPGAYSHLFWFGGIPLNGNSQTIHWPHPFGVGVSHPPASAASIEWRPEEAHRFSWADTNRFVFHRAESFTW
jgi:hypothetical protein